MGSDKEWSDYFPNPDEKNPFETARWRLPDRVGTLEDVTTCTEESRSSAVLTNTLLGVSNDGASDGVMPPEAADIAEWPKRFPQAFVNWGQLAGVEGSSCCVEVLFKKLEVTNLNQIDGCNVLLLPESQKSGPFYNPSFFPKEVMKPRHTSGKLGQIWRKKSGVWRRKETQTNHERQVLPLGQCRPLC